mgnify:CR=1 FL=1
MKKFGKKEKHEISVPKMRFAQGNDAKNKGGHLKANVKKRIDGQRDNKRMQNVDHDWPKDKKTW